MPNGIDRIEKIIDFVNLFAHTCGSVIDVNTTKDNLPCEIRRKDKSYAMIDTIPFSEYDGILKQMKTNPDAVDERLADLISTLGSNSSYSSGMPMTGLYYLISRKQGDSIKPFIEVCVNWSSFSVTKYYIPSNDDIDKMREIPGVDKYIFNWVTDKNTGTHTIDADVNEFVDFAIKSIQRIYGMINDEFNVDNTSALASLNMYNDDTTSLVVVKTMINNLSDHLKSVSLSPLTFNIVPEKHISARGNVERIDTTKFNVWLIYKTYRICCLQCFVNESTPFIQVNRNSRYVRAEEKQLHLIVPSFISMLDTNGGSSGSDMYPGDKIFINGKIAENTAWIKLKFTIASMCAAIELRDAILDFDKSGNLAVQSDFNANVVKSNNVHDLIVLNTTYATEANQPNYIKLKFDNSEGNKSISFVPVSAGILARNIVCPLRPDVKIGDMIYAVFHTTTLAKELKAELNHLAVTKVSYDAEHGEENQKQYDAMIAKNQPYMTELDSPDLDMTKKENREKAKVKSRIRIRKMLSNVLNDVVDVFSFSIDNDTVNGMMVLHLYVGDNDTDVGNKVHVSDVLVNSKFATDDYVLNHPEDISVQFRYMDADRDCVVTTKPIYPFVTIDGHPTMDLIDVLEKINPSDDNLSESDDDDEIEELNFDD